jgi:hypothetical protein
MTAPILKPAIDFNRLTAISTKPRHTELTPSSAIELVENAGTQRHRATAHGPNSRPLTYCARNGFQDLRVFKMKSLVEPYYHRDARREKGQVLRIIGPSLIGNLVVLIAATATVAASAQGTQTPDFSSATAGWTTPIAGDFTAVPGFPGPMLSNPAHPFLNNVEARERGITPSYRIGDLSNSNLKPGVKDAMQKDNDEVLAGKIAYSPSTSCKPAGVPAYLLQPGVLYFVQTPKEVVMIQSYDSQVRHIYLDVPHSAKVKTSWYGESVGHYEADTLVIDTVGLSNQTFVDAYRTPHSDKLHVIERWKLTQEDKGLEVTITVDDPETYYQPWKAVLRYRRTPGAVLEAICAENNQQFDYHMPVAKDPDF